MRCRLGGFADRRRRLMASRLASTEAPALRPEGRTRGGRDRKSIVASMVKRGQTGGGQVGVLRSCVPCVRQPRKRARQRGGEGPQWEGSHPDEPWVPLLVVDRVVHVPYTVEQDETGWWAAHARCPAVVQTARAAAEEAVADLREALDGWLAEFGVPD